MARKKKDEDAAETPVIEKADAVADLISTATDETDSGAVESSDDAAVDALDAARNEPEAAAETQTEKPKRGRPAGSQTRKEKPQTDVAEIPKTKKGLQDYAAKLKAERDAARAAAEAKKTEIDTEAVSRLAAALAAGGQMVGHFMASRKGPHWKLQPNESEALGMAWATCLAPYADTIGATLPWVIAVGVTYNVFAGRVAIDQAAEAEAMPVVPDGDKRQEAIR